MKTLVVIPTINSHRTILDVVDSVKKISTVSSPVEVLVVDFGSTDLTREYLINNNVPHIATPIKSTFSHALDIGMKYALMNNYDNVVEFDDVGIIKPKEIEKLIAASENADLVLASRFLNEDEKKWISSKIMTLLARLKTKKVVSDITMRLKLFKVKAIKWYIESKFWEPEPHSIIQMIRDGISYCEVSVEFSRDYSQKDNERYFGTTNSRIRITWNTLLAIMFLHPMRVIYSDRPSKGVKNAN